MLRGQLQVRLEDIIFDRCILVVPSAAQATLSKPTFRNIAASQLGLGVIVHGCHPRLLCRAALWQAGCRGRLCRREATSAHWPRLLCEGEPTDQRSPSGGVQLSLPRIVGLMWG